MLITKADVSLHFCSSTRNLFRHLWVPVSPKTFKQCIIKLGKELSSQPTSTSSAGPSMSQRGEKKQTNQKPKQEKQPYWAFQQHQLTSYWISHLRQIRGNDAWSSDGQGWRCEQVTPGESTPELLTFNQGADEDKQHSNARCRATPLSRSLSSRPAQSQLFPKCRLAWSGLALLGNALIQWPVPEVQSLLHTHRTSFCSHLIF